MEHLLYEHSKGFLLFELKDFEDLSRGSFNEYMRLTQSVNLVATFEFTDVNKAIDNIQILNTNILPTDLVNFLEINHVKVLHCDLSLKKALKKLKIKQKTSSNIMRAIKQNEHRFIKADLDLQFLLGVSHTFSRNKVEYNSKVNDNILINTVYMMEQLEKDINSYSMRIKEFYGWCFPELYRECADNDEYIEVMTYFINKEDNNNLSEDKIQKFTDLKANTIGIELSEMDVYNIKNLCNIIKEKIDIRNNLKSYLEDKMMKITPNLCELIGHSMSAKLIVLSGGLSNLAKLPASTIQLLGAEKSLFKSLKSNMNTPKYGVLFYSKLIGKANLKNKGRFSRYLASKIALLSKIDCYSTERTNLYGKALRKQVDKKLKAFETNKSVENTDEILSKIYKKLKNC